MKLVGELPLGTTATDLVLTVTQMLRKKGVVDKFVEFYGPGLSALGLADRATIANMAPEYGATMGFFPVDAETVRYLERTGRGRAVCDRVERYCKEQGLFRTDATPDPEFTATLQLDLGTVDAQPGRPQAAPGPGAAHPAQAQLHREPAGPDERQRPVGAEGAGGERLLALDGRGRRQRHHGGPRSRRDRRRRLGRRRSGRAADRDRPARRQRHHAARRRGGHRGHHELYQHLEPVGDDRGGPGGPEGGGARAHDEAVGQDQPGARVAGGDRLPRGIGPAALPRAAPVPYRGIRVHHLHRQQRARCPK